MMVNFIIKCLFYGLFLRELVNSQIAYTRQGIIIGRYNTTRNGRLFRSFTGLPFAEPPVGPLRFQAPRPYSRTGEIVNATVPKDICYQIQVLTDRTVAGTEDCLYLNVYTPVVPSRTRRLLPVLIAIHGGSLTFGNAGPDFLNPSFMLDKDIILVMPAYRLGPLGFLSLNDEVLPGNNGLKDQVLAIQWVKNNIADFSGDPNRITLIGGSAGASSVHYHMLSPLSRNLIIGAISRSGVSISPFATPKTAMAKRNSRRLAEYFNCSLGSSIEIVRCLRRVSAADITNQQKLFTEWNYDPCTPFPPVIEPDLPGAFITEHPITTIKSGRSAKIPFIAGINTQDGAMKSASIFGNDALMNDFNENRNSILPITLDYRDTSPDVQYVTDTINRYYFNNKNISQTEEYRTNVTDMYTDGFFMLQTNCILRLHLKYTNSPIYNYIFGHRGPKTCSIAFGDTEHYFGVSHGDDLIYFMPLGIDVNNNSTDPQIVEILTALISNFAITGNPNYPEDEQIPNTFEPVRTNNLEYYYITDSAVMADRFNWNRDRLWRRLPLANYTCEDILRNNDF